MSVRRQLRRHSVAIISLLVALTSLAYNTWRNEQTEANRNVRNAGVEILVQLGALDQVLFFSHYERDPERGSPREGWAIVLVVRDLGSLMPAPADTSTAMLVKTWQSNWQGLGNREHPGAERISSAIETTRGDVRAVLAALD